MQPENENKILRRWLQTRCLLVTFHALKIMMSHPCARPHLMSRPTCLWAPRWAQAHFLVKQRRCWTEKWHITASVWNQRKHLVALGVRQGFWKYHGNRINCCSRQISRNCDFNVNAREAQTDEPRLPQRLSIAMKFGTDNNISPRLNYDDFWILLCSPLFSPSAMFK